MVERRLTRRKLAAGAMALASGLPRDRADAALNVLVDRLVTAERDLEAAMDVLARAEERWAGLPKAKETEPDCLPEWYQAAMDAEAAAGDAAEALHQRIAATPARTVVGVATKLRILARLCGLDLDDEAPDVDTDICAVLLKSIIADLRQAPFVSSAVVPDAGLRRQ